MTHAQLSQLAELIEWLESTIEPIQGRPWQVTLNSSGPAIEVRLQIVESVTNSPNQSMTITRVEQARFLTPKRKSFSTD